MDFGTRYLFFWPPSRSGELVVSQLERPLILANGVSHVQFTGLVLEGSLGDGIQLEAVDSVLVAGCTIRRIGGNAILLNGRNTTVQSCDLHDLGRGGILVSGGEARSLARSELSILNNHIHRYGVREAMYSAAVNVGFGGLNAKGRREAVGVRVAHNLIHDAPRDAILVSGQDHVFELNEIFRCGFGSADLGAFYSWLDWTIRGVVIRHNYIHDTVGGVNPDDGATGFLVHGNVFVGPATGVWIASGADHTVRHNIFVKDNGPVFGIDDRGVSRGYATNRRLIQPLQAMAPAEPPWSERFPEVRTFLDERPELPHRTRFVGNLVVMKTGQLVLNKMSRDNRDNPGLLTVADNWVTPDDPGFINPAKGDFSLRPDSPAFTQIPGFEPIPFNKIGLQLDTFRTSLPDASITRRPVPNSPSPFSDFGT
jgi:hypothetical protein